MYIYGFIYSIRESISPTNVMDINESCGGKNGTAFSSHKKDAGGSYDESGGTFYSITLGAIEEINAYSAAKSSMFMDTFNTTTGKEPLICGECEGCQLKYGHKNNQLRKKCSKRRCANRGHGVANSDTNAATDSDGQTSVEDSVQEKRPKATAKKPVTFTCPHCLKDFTFNPRTAAASFASHTRVCKQRKEQSNQPVDGGAPSSISNYFGISYNKQNKKWQAYIRPNKKKKENLGHYNLRCDAALAYDKAAIELGRWTNFNTPYEYEKAKKLELEHIQTTGGDITNPSVKDSVQENKPEAASKKPADASFGRITRACENKNEKTIQRADDEELPSDKIEEDHSDANGANMSVRENQFGKADRKKTSIYTGVTYYKCQNNFVNWQSQIKKKDKSVYLERHNLECDAALAYDKATLQLRGPAAKTNFSTMDEYEKAKKLELERMQTTGGEVMVDTADAEKEETISNNTGASYHKHEKKWQAGIRRENVELEELSEKKKRGRDRPMKVKHCLLLPGAGQLANSQKMRKIEWKEELPGDMVMELEHRESICFACHHGIEGGICNCF